MAVVYPRRTHIPEGYIGCAKCGTTGRMLRPRETWEAPLIGDGTTSCDECHSLGMIPNKSVEGDNEKG
jgi:hypothetical protein